MAKISTLKRATPRMKYVHMNHVMAFNENLKDRQQNPTDRDTALFEIKALFENDEKFHNWFNALYDATKAKGMITEYDDAILKKLADLQLAKEIANELHCDTEWLQPSVINLDALNNQSYKDKHVTGRTCPHCGITLTVNETVRKTTNPDKPDYTRRLVCPNYFVNGCSYKEKWTDAILMTLYVQSVKLEHEPALF